VVPQRPEQSSSLSVTPVQSSVRLEQLARVAPARRPIGATAPQYFTAAPIGLPDPQDDWPTSRNSIDTSPPLVANRNSPRQMTRTTPPPGGQPESTQTAGTEQQGTVALDGAQLGRWVIDHLERQASRPGTMTTGVDPRMTATFPGAPIGA
jgi:hypothetical protein